MKRIAIMLTATDPRYYLYVRLNRVSGFEIAVYTVRKYVKKLLVKKFESRLRNFLKTLLTQSAVLI